MFTRLEEWRKERGLDQVKSEPVVIIKHMLIELTEALEAVHNKDNDEILDGVLDSIIYGLNGLSQWGVDVPMAMNECLKEIESRKGYFDVKEQKFQKKITGKEYKANYQLALRNVY